MSNFTNREALYSAYLNSDRKHWETVMGTYVIEGKSCSKKLYYLSLDSTLEDNFFIDESFDDKMAKQQDLCWQQIYAIPLPQRLLANTDIQGCWNQLFPRLLECYKMETDYNRPIELYMYEVDVTDCVIIENDVLVNHNIVHNAFANNTHAVFGLPKLRMVEKLLVTNTLTYPDERCTYYVPFNDPKYNPCLLSTTLEILSTMVVNDYING